MPQCKKACSVWLHAVCGCLVGRATAWLVCNHKGGRRMMQTQSPEYSRYASTRPQTKSLPTKATNNFLRPDHLSTSLDQFQQEQKRTLPEAASHLQHWAADGFKQQCQQGTLSAVSGWQQDTNYKSKSVSGLKAAARQSRGGWAAFAAPSATRCDARSGGRQQHHPQRSRCDTTDVHPMCPCLKRELTSWSRCHGWLHIKQ
jgi:hypothetical protein